jgi:regulator of nucleoside diphosphate kinase
MTEISWTAPALRIWAPDLYRLQRLALSADAAKLPTARFLLSELNRAAPYESEQPLTDAVGVNNWVSFRVTDKTARECRLLVFPDDFRNAETHLSILSPLGAALIGLRVGSRMPYVDLDGELRLVTVEAIGVDNFNGRPEIAVAICTALLLAAWLALAVFFRPLWPVRHPSAFDIGI